MAQEYYDPNLSGGARQPHQTAPAANNRWSVHLANDPFGGAAGQWAKQYYDNPNVDPGSEIQKQVQQFRQQYGLSADQGDREVIEMIATGQTPAPRAASSSISTGQFPVQQFPNQLQTIQGTPRNDELYNLLIGRAQQGLALDRNDPIIRAQADAYAANEERARRNYVSDAAERYGPLANIRGEERMAAERAGQRTGAFEAELLGRELQARRDEIAQSLSQLGSMLSDDQRLALTRELELLNLALREQGMGLQQGQLDLGFADLGLRAEQQSAYWDWIRSGGNLG